MVLKIDKIEATTVMGQAIEVHAFHVTANGTGGHSARDEWRNCRHPQCEAFQESISGPKGLSGHQGGTAMIRTVDTTPVEAPPVVLDCPACSGSGFAHPCPDCHGTEPANATPGCDTCLGLGGYGSCQPCAGTGSTVATSYERAAMKILDALLQLRAH